MKEKLAAILGIAAAITLNIPHSEAADDVNVTAVMSEPSRDDFDCAAITFIGYFGAYRAHEQAKTDEERERYEGAIRGNGSAAAFYQGRLTAFAPLTSLEPQIRAAFQRVNALPSSDYDRTSDACYKIAKQAASVFAPMGFE